MEQEIEYITPGKVYMVFGTEKSAELLTKQKSPLGGRTWEVARNEFSGSFEKCKIEALRREAWILKNQR
jgi:hypothetical protein